MATAVRANAKKKKSSGNVENGVQKRKKRSERPPEPEMKLNRFYGYQVLLGGLGKPIEYILSYDNYEEAEQEAKAEIGEEDGDFALIIPGTTLLMKNKLL